MSFLFGGRLQDASSSRKDHARESKRMVQRACRRLQAERAVMEREHQALAADLERKCVAGESMAGLRRAAEKLVRCGSRLKGSDATIERFGAIQHRLDEVQNTASMTSAMQKAISAMRQVRGATSIGNLSQIVRDFEREDGMMQLGAEMLDETMDDIQQQEDDRGLSESTADDVVRDILARQGLALSDVFPAAPSGQNGARMTSDDGSADMHIEERIRRLKA